MTGSDEQLARAIAVRLDQAAADIAPGIAYRLQQARARALDGERATATEPQLAHAFAGGASAGGGRPLWAQWRLWAGIAVIVAAAWGWQQWHAYRQVLTYEELDAQILSSDLPIDAYLDRGFDAWLKTSSAN
ncbi:MAG: DUF3619 family protein [Betaproteobacteria bacterium]